MVKLVRMVSNDPNGFFESQFNTNIVLQPNSKIGLLSFSGSLTPVEAFLDLNLVSFYGYNDPTDDTAVARINNGLYNAANYNELLQHLEDELNKVTILEDGNDHLEVLGGQFSVRIDNAKPTIEWKLAYNTIDLTSHFINNNISYTKGTRLINATDLANSTNSLTKSNSLGRYNTALATGYFNVKINKLVIDAGAPVGQVQSNGFLIGFSKRDLRDVSPLNFDESMIDYSIGVGSSDGANYTIYRREKGTITDLGQAPNYAGEGNATNSEILIYRNANAIEISYTTAAGVRTPLHEYDIEHDYSEYYPFLIFHSGQAYIKLEFEGATLDPYNLPLTSQETSNTAFINPVMEGTQLAPLYKFDLSLAAGFCDFFGFTSPSTHIYQQTSQERTANTGTNRGSFKIQANRDFRPALGATSYILEILNINLESYDSSQKQRKNILSSLIINDAMDGLTKDDGGVIFMSMGNKERVDLRNIKLRLVNQNYEPVTTVGTNVATLLFDDALGYSF